MQSIRNCPEEIHWIEDFLLYRIYDSNQRKSKSIAHRSESNQLGMTAHSDEYRNNDAGQGAYHGICQ